MTIHSELILELSKTENITKIAYQKPIGFQIRPTDWYLAHEKSKTWFQMAPDFVIERSDRPKTTIQAVEIESDIKYDFDDSLKQIRKYLKYYNMVSVIIPKRYEKFAPLYLKSNVRVWTWEADRVWGCVDCGTTRIDSRSRTEIHDECSNQRCKSRVYELKGITNFKLNEYISQNPIEIL